LNIILDQTEQF